VTRRRRCLGQLRAQPQFAQSESDRWLLTTARRACRFYGRRHIDEVAQRLLHVLTPRFRAPRPRADHRRRLERIGLLKSRKLLQRADQHRNEVRRAQGHRDSYPAGPERQTLGENVADDSCYAPLAVNDRRLRSAVIDHKTVVTSIHFQERGARELLAVSEAGKPTTHEPRDACCLGDCQDRLFR
jgi:hypothetical protein